MTIAKFAKASSYLFATIVLALGNVSLGSEVWAGTSVVVRYVSCLAFIGCFGYLHYGFDSYLMPLRALSDPERASAKEAIRFAYRSSFFYSTVSAGYICLLLDLLQIAFPTDVSLGQGYLFGAFALVVLGTSAKARALILHLTEQPHA